jgi:hypothetical protein
MSREPVLVGKLSRLERIFRSGSTLCSIIAVCCSVGEVKTVPTKFGNAPLAELTLADPSRAVFSVSVWGQTAASVQTIRAGDVVQITGLRVQGARFT